MSPHQDRCTYERDYGTYRQPRFAMRKILGRLLPILPGWRLRNRLYHLMGVDIDPEVQFIGLDTYIDDVFPELISIGAKTVISLRAMILAHDDASHTVAPVRIGRGVFIGAGAIILPGVEIGDRAVIGAGAVVTRDVPSDARAVGVPARCIE